MSYALVAHAAEPGAVSGPITTPAIDSTGATLLIIAVGYYDGGSGLAVSDSESNAYTALTKYTGSGSADIQLWYCLGGTVGAGHTATVNGSSVFASIAFAAFAGAPASAPVFDQQNGAAALQAGSITPTADNELVIAAATDSSSMATGIDSGFTLLDRENSVGSTCYGVGLAYQIQTTATAVNPSWISGINGPSTIASFFAGSPSPTPTPTPTPTASGYFGGDGQWAAQAGTGTGWVDDAGVFHAQEGDGTGWVDDAGRFHAQEGEGTGWFEGGGQWTAES